MLKRMGGIVCVRQEVKMQMPWASAFDSCAQTQTVSLFGYSQGEELSEIGNFVDARVEKRCCGQNEVLP